MNNHLPLRFGEPRVGQLVRWHAKKSHTYVRALHFDLSDEAKALIGQVFGVISAETDQRHGDTLTAHIEDAFIHGLSDAVRNLSDASTQEQVFQRAIARVNHTIASLLDDDGLPIGPHQICGAIVSRRRDEAVAAAWGHPSLLLVRPGKGAVRIYDLLLESREEERVPHAIAAPTARGFSNLIHGGLGEQDRLVLATRELREFVDERRLTAAVTANDAFSAMRVLHDLLSPLKPEISVAISVSDSGPLTRPEAPLMAALATAAGGEQPSPEDPPSDSSTQKSIDALLETQARTEGILEPSLLGALLGRVKKHAGALPAAFTGLLGRRQEASPIPEPDWRERLLTDERDRHEAVRLRQERKRGDADGAAPQQKFMDAFWNDFQAANGAPEGDGNEEVRLRPTDRETLRAAVITPRAAETPIVRTSLDGSGRTFGGPVWSKVSRGFQGLSPAARLGTISVLVLAVALNASLAVAGVRSKDAKARRAFDARVETIERNLDAAESALIYRDDGRTRKLIIEASAAAEGLPQDSSEHRATRTRLMKDAATVHTAYRRAAGLGAPEILATVVAQAAPVALSHVSFADGTVWMLSAAGDIFRISPDGAVGKVGSDVPADAAIAAQNGHAIVIGDRGDVLDVGPDGKMTAKTISWEGADRRVTDLALYEGRPYVLDATHNRILRIPAAAEGFGKPQAYLKDGTDVSSGVGLTVDGTVWLLTSQGEIIKLLRGTRRDYEAEPADPPVTAATALAASSTSFFVLEPSAARILRYAKDDGRLETQYEADALAQATGLAVTPDGKYLVVTVGNRVLRYGLEIKR